MSIELFIDESNDHLIAVENCKLDKDDHSHNELLRLPLDNIRARQPAEIQRTLGRLILSFLNSRSANGLNLPRDLEDESDLDQKHFDQLTSKPPKDTPEEAYDLAVSLIGRGIDSGKWEDIEKGEALLIKAVTAGLPEAIKYHSEVWTLVRPRLEQKLKSI